MAALSHVTGFSHAVRTTIPIAALAMVLAALSASPVAAQQTDRAGWGIAGSFTPEWEFLHFLEDAMDKSVSMKGDELRIGLVRGKPFGGEWGISYVRRRVADGSTLVQEKPKCLSGATTAPVCAGGTAFETRGAFLNGVQWHRFIAVGTIGRRVQIGAVISGGVARLEGDAEETVEHLQVTVNPATGARGLSIGRETNVVEARQIFSHTFVAEYVPIGGVEAAVAVIVAPELKVRLSSGASFPSFHRVSLTATYLFGTQN